LAHYGLGQPTAGIYYTIMAPITGLPGPDWSVKLVRGAKQNNNHWTSPIRCIEFKRFKAACDFEELRKKYNNDEVRAWAEFRTNTVGGNAYVVSPFQYDEPGPNWIFKLVKEYGQNRSHWLSPVRHIEFKRYKQASQFEQLRNTHGHDEVRAWIEFRKIAGKNTCVVCPFKYDTPGLSWEKKSKRKLIQFGDRREHHDAKDVQRPTPAPDDSSGSLLTDVVAKDGPGDRRNKRSKYDVGVPVPRSRPKPAAWESLAAFATTRPPAANGDSKIFGGTTPNENPPLLSHPTAIDNNYNAGFDADHVADNVDSASGGGCGLNEEREGERGDSGLNEERGMTKVESGVYSRFFNTYWDMIDK
jgi:hypothetical protein